MEGLWIPCPLNSVYIPENNIPWFRVEDFVVEWYEPEEGFNDTLCMWKVKFDDNSMVRLWTSSLQLNNDILKIKIYRSAYYKKDFKIKSVKKELI